MTRVRLGNPAPHEGVTDPKTDKTTLRPLDSGPSITTVDAPGKSAIQVVHDIIAAGGVWENHGAEPPSWVASDDPLVEQLLAEHFDCPRGEPSKGRK